jgi:hypothetical protein
MAEQQHLNTRPTGEPNLAIVRDAGIALTKAGSGKSLAKAELREKLLNMAHEWPLCSPASHLLQAI